MSNIYKEMWEIANKLENIKNYDAESFVKSLKSHVHSLDFFYSTLAVQVGNDTSKARYKLKSHQVKPLEHKIAFFNLQKGYPKELADPHWCYILKDFDVKYIAIPLTSVKKDDDGNYKVANPKFEFDIEIKDFINSEKSRLNVDEIRVLDLQRYIPDKGVYDVVTSRDDIITNTNKIIYGGIDVADSDKTV